jgi:uncharacterized protein YceK
MNPVRRNGREIFLLLLVLGFLTAGCASRLQTRLREQNAYLAGQNAMLMQQQANGGAPLPGVTVVGAVQYPQVPWVAGLTLAQAVATANYVGAIEPKQIIINRNGESATMDASVLLDGKDVPLEIGDIVELR